MFFFNVTATTEIYPSCPPLSLHDALPISSGGVAVDIESANNHRSAACGPSPVDGEDATYARSPTSRAGFVSFRSEHIRPFRVRRSEEHTSELQSLMRISYAVFCLKKKNTNKKIQATTTPLLNYCSI